MADIDVVEKKGSTPGTGSMPAWVWAVIAVLAVGGLMTWLAVQSERVTTAAVVEETPRNDRPARGAVGFDDDDPAEPAELADVAAAPEPVVGQRLAFRNVEVAATLGPSAFWGDVPGANPFLVLFSPNIADAPELEAGQTFDLQGVINVVTEEALTEWVESGAIRPGARDEAGFATHYLLAERIDG